MEKLSQSFTILARNFSQRFATVSRHGGDSGVALLSTTHQAFSHQAFSHRLFYVIAYYCLFLHLLELLLVNSRWRPSSPYHSSATYILAGLICSPTSEPTKWYHGAGVTHSSLGLNIFPTLSVPYLRVPALTLTSPPLPAVYGYFRGTLPLSVSRVRVSILSFSKC